MKFLFYILIFFFISSKSFSQGTQDTIIISPVPSDKPITGRLGGDRIEWKPLYVINGIIIEDTLILEKLRKNHVKDILKVKRLYRKEAFKKYGIEHDAGLIIIYTRRNIIINK